MMKKMEDGEVRDWLERHLPKWRLEDGYLKRKYETGGWQKTMLLANGIAYLAEATFHHPDLELGYPAVTVRLRTHDADGITARDTELATKIEEFVTWQPGADSPFDGAPGDWIQ